MNSLAQKNSNGIATLTSDLKIENLSLPSNEQNLPAESEKYVVFCLGADFFAVSSNNVSEVVQMLSVTQLPNVPKWLLGIADLRGTMISVVSLRNLLGDSNAALAQRAKFIVLKSANFPSPIALAVDRVSEIVFIAMDEIQFSHDPKTPYLIGKTINKSNALSLLNADNLLSALKI